MLATSLDVERSADGSTDTCRPALLDEPLFRHVIVRELLDDPLGRNALAVALARCLCHTLRLQGIAQKVKGIWVPL